MSKRINLLRAVYSHNMDILREMKPNDPNYWTLSGKITKLHKRIRPKNKTKVVQESMFRNYTIEYKKNGKIKEKVLQATTRNNAQFAFWKLFGQETKILSIQ